MKKLTRILFATATAILALASCDKIPSSDVTCPDNEIRFGNAGINVETKAFIEATNSTLQTNGFNVAAITDSDNSTMFNKAVAYSGGTFSVPGEKYYFPASGTMSFYAVYPKTQAITVSNGAATLSYNQNADTDLITAKKTAVSRTPGAVPLSFDHLLSQVSIKAQGKETTVDYKVFSVKITDANGGTYAYADGTWTPSSTTQAYTVYNNASGMTVSTNSMTDVGSAMSFMPGDVKLQVVWKCYNKGTSTVLCEKDVTVDVNLPQGKHSTLNLTLPFNLSNLKFDISVGTWVSDSQDIEIKEPYKPELVNGVFTVNNSGKKVKFTKGNLYWNGSEFRCEDTQYACPANRHADYIGHFFWSKTASVAYAASYNDPDKTTSDKFFAADGGIFEDFTVLSSDEWEYVLSHSLVVNPPVTKSTIVTEEDIQIVINGVNCIVLMPDGFSGTVKTTYTAAEWVEAEKNGLVALPFAGNYFNSSIYSAGSYGNYWSSNPYEDNADSAWGAYFDDDEAGTYHNYRHYGISIRLVSVQ